MTPAQRARHADASTLAQALADSRRDTLQTFAAFEAALPSLQVPYAEELNPPLWELGHVGWFQSWWLARNPERAQGWQADPQAPRHAPARAQADALYDSRYVTHATRWSLPLPDARTTRADIAAQLDITLDLLATETGADATRLYFFRLALLHEDMHHEAALYMAQALGIAIHDACWQPPALPEPGPPLALPATRWTLGTQAGAGFVFDNECGHAVVDLPAVQMEAQVLRWQDYLPFVEDGGYTQDRWWSATGWQWLQSASRGTTPTATALAAPRYLRQDGGNWQSVRYGTWRPLDLREPACHLSWHEAQAWCRWAGRRLPTEAEWARAQAHAPQDLRWGDVWEWTASPFAPYAGFEPHPYREYSAPWFDGRPVLRGASFMTQARMRHPDYRNFFTPDRNDIAAGFRTCKTVSA
ncbi:MAG: hypothetical protein RL522_2883 [Pseudomonadota bacterium]|jgi:ergothioneine biosynthesis protein EgtB